MAVAHKRLLWLEAALGHLVGLEGMRVLHLLATGLLAHLPLELGDVASRASAPHKTDRRVTDLDFIGDVQDLDLGIELLGLSKRGVLLVHHHVSRTEHVLLVETLDVQANLIAKLGLLGTFQLKVLLACFTALC